MTLRRLGLGYLVAVVADAAISIAGIADASVKAFSNQFSGAMYLFTIVVMVFAFMGRLRPASAFLIPVALYICFFWFGLGLGVAMWFTKRPAGMTDDVSQQTLQQTFSWYGTTALALAVLQLAIGVGCLWRAARPVQST